MFFQMYFPVNEVRRQLFGAIGKRKRVYFVTSDLNPILHGDRRLPQWVETYSNCDMGDIVAECPQALAQVGVIEFSALIHLLLRGNLPSACELRDALETCHFKCMGVVNDTMLLEKCDGPEGKCLLEWVQSTD